MSDEMDSYSEMRGHRYAPSSGFPEWGFDEPDDSDTIYYNTWAEAEAAAVLTRKWVAEYHAQQKARGVQQPELIGKE